MMYSWFIFSATPISETKFICGRSFMQVMISRWNYWLFLRFMIFLIATYWPRHLPRYTSEE